MHTLLLPLTIFLFLEAAEPARRPHPLAPSLPELTKEEEAQIDGIIQAFIQFEMGKVKGAEGQKAQADFDKLGPEATFALIRGLNEAVRQGATCPVVTIGRKLRGILRASNDPALLDFAHENIGAGIGKAPHYGLLRELRMIAMLRRRDVAQGVAPRPGEDGDGKIVIRPRQPGDNSIAGMSTIELARAASTAKGDRLKDLLTELAKRPSATAITALVNASGDNQDSQIRYLALELLQKNLARQSNDTVKAKLKDERNEVRIAAIWVVAEKRLRLGDELIELLRDRDLDIAQAARQALQRVAGGDIDYGPERNATADERAEAIRKWQDWWARQSGP